MEQVATEHTLAAGPDEVPAPLPLSPGKKLAFALVCLGLMLIMTCALAEVGLHLNGQRPWRIKHVMWEVQPGGKYFAPHPRLGYTLLPGRFKIDWHPQGSFSATHLEPALTRLDHPVRATHPLDTYDPNSAKPEIWIFGCSWAYGSRLDDHQTFAWLLQEALPQFEVVNFAVSGYGTLHALLQLEGAIGKRTAPKVAIVTYASFHDERNTFLRSRRKVVAPYCRLGPLVQPYARLDRDGNLIRAMALTEYTEFPLMRHSAMMHQLEIWYDQTEERLYHSHQVSKAIIHEMAKMCRKNGISLVVAGMANEPLTLELLEHARAQGILATDISLDMTIPAHTLMPYDHHPSALANRRYAEKLEQFLRPAMFKNEAHGTLAVR